MTLVALRNKQSLSSTLAGELESLANLLEFRLFPEVFRTILEIGEVLQFPSGGTLLAEGDDFDQLLVPLRGTLVIKIKSGRAYDESDLVTVQNGEFFGVWETLDRRRSPYNVASDEAVTVFACAANGFRKIMRENPDAENVFRTLATSKASRNFGTWLLDQSVTPEVCIRLLKQIDHKEIKFKKGSALKTRSAQFFLIQSGNIGVSKKEENKDYLAFLKPGDFFGLSQALPDANLHFYPHFISDCHLHLLAAEILKAELPSSVYEALAREPRVLVDIDEDVKTEVTLLTGTKKANPLLIEEFGFKPIKIELSDGTLRSTSLVAIRNLFHLLDFKVPEHLLMSYLVHREHMSLNNFAEVFEGFGFMARIVHSSSEALEIQSYPALVLFKGRPLVLVGVKKEHLLFIEPFGGLMAIRISRFSNRWNQLLLEVKKSPVHDVTLDDKADATSFKPEIVGRKILRFLNHGARPFLIQLISLNSFQTFVIAAIPTFFMSMLSDILGNKSFHLLNMYLVGLLLILFFQLIAQYMQKLTQNNAESYYKFDSHSYFYKLTLESPANYVNPLKTGSIVSKFASIDFLVNSSWKKILELPVAIISFIVYLAIVSSYSWQAGSMIILFAAMAVGLANYLRNKVGLDELSTGKLRQDVIDRWTEYLSGMDTIKSTGVEPIFRKTTENIAIDLAQSGRTYSTSMQKISSLSTFVFSLAPVTSVYICAHALMSKSLAMEDLMGVSIYASFCTQPVMSVVNLILYATTSPGLLQTAGGMARIETDKKLTKIESLIPINLKGKVRFERVSYRYSERGVPAVSDVSFTIEPGQVVAIVGRSGSGKTTLARLISRHIKPVAGKIFYDDSDSREINDNLLIDQIGFVTQTPQLFSGTLAANIGYSDDFIDMKRVKQASIASGAHTFITKLGSGYNYFLSEEGFGLSSGQKQMISTARILYKNPRMLILDEATAHLDPKAEKIISNKLLKYLNYRTVVVVVQRISTARKADLILVMKNGHLAEAGSHNQLMQTGGEYADLYRNQVGVD